MIKPALNENILRLIQEIGYVKPEQLYLMFGLKHSKEAINFQITQLVSHHLVSTLEDGSIVSTERFRFSNQIEKELNTALSVMCNLGEDKILEYYVARYPVSLLFITTDNIVYDITVFNDQCWKGKTNLIFYTRSISIPKGIEDSTVHIAIVANEELADHLKSFNFDVYAIVNPDYTINYFRIEDE